MTARLAQTDEETPLLASETHNASHKRKHTPIPWGQFAILLVLQLAEPLTSQVIYPFAPEVSRIPTHSETQTNDDVSCVALSSSGISASLTEMRQKWDTMSVSWYVTLLPASRENPQTAGPAAFCRSYKNCCFSTSIFMVASQCARARHVNQPHIRGRRTIVPSEGRLEPLMTRQARCECLYVLQSGYSLDERLKRVRLFNACFGYRMAVAACGFWPLSAV